MKNKLKKTVAIAICTYNEEKNIGSLLKKLTEQEDSSFILDSIYVFNDGSTDKTEFVVRKYMKEFKKIKLISDRERKGKANRLNDFYKIAKTDIIVSLDGDVVVGNNNTIHEITSMFESDNVGLVNGNVLPLEPVTFVEKIVVSYEKFWKKTTDQINNGNNIHNSIGCLVAMSRKFYKNFQFQKGIVAEDHFLYLKAQEQGFECRFSKNAIVFYSAPQTIKDYLSQFSRYFSSQEKIEKYFGKYAQKYYEIPRIYKLKAYLISFLKNPLYISLGILLQFLQKINFHNNSNNNGNLWTVIRSSK